MAKEIKSKYSIPFKKKEYCDRCKKITDHYFNVATEAYCRGYETSHSYWARWDLYDVTYNCSVCDNFSIIEEPPYTGKIVRCKKHRQLDMSDLPEIDLPDGVLHEGFFDKREPLPSVLDHEAFREIYKDMIGCFNDFHFDLFWLGYRALLKLICTFKLKADQFPMDTEDYTQPIELMHKLGFLSAQDTSTLKNISFTKKFILSEVKLFKRQETILALDIIEKMLSWFCKNDDKIIKSPPKIKNRDKFLPEIKTHCSKCGEITVHRIYSYTFQYDYSYYTNPECWEFGGMAFNEIQCKQCYSTDTTDYYDFDYTRYNVEKLDKLATKEYDHVPWQLMHLLRQSVESYNDGYPTLCGKGLKTILENIGEKGFFHWDKHYIVHSVSYKKEKSEQHLITKLNSFLKQGFITQENIDYLLSLQIMEYFGIYLEHPPKRKELLKTIYLIESLLDLFYEVPGNLKTLLHSDEDDFEG